MLSRKSDILQFHYPLLTVVHPSLVLLVDEGSDIITWHGVRKMSEVAIQDPTLRWTLNVYWMAVWAVTIVISKSINSGMLPSVVHLKFPPRQKLTRLMKPKVLIIWPKYPGPYTIRRIDKRASEGSYDGQNSV